MTVRLDCWHLSGLVRSTQFTAGRITANRIIDGSLVESLVGSLVGSLVELLPVESLPITAGAITACIPFEGTEQMANPADCPPTLVNSVFRVYHRGTQPGRTHGTRFGAV